MITITIDNNNDRITIHNPDSRPAEIEIKITGRVSEVKRIVQCVLENTCDGKIPVMLEEINEDEKYTIEEW